MIKKLAITHSLNKTIYAILRRRLNGNIYNAATGKEEALGTWHGTRKAACAVMLTDKGSGYYTAEFPGGCDDGVWDVFYYEQLGAAVDIDDRLIGREKFINGAASIEERSMLAAGYTSGKTTYALIRSQSNAYIWDAVGETLEEIGTWDNTRLAECAYTLDDKGGDYYTKTFPAGITAAGTYHIQYYDRIGTLYDITDRLIGRDKILWFGTIISDEIVPTGPRGLAMVNLRNLVAECESWQAWTGAADAEEAKNYLHITACTPADGIFAEPFGLICRTPNDKDEAIAVDADNVNGDLELRFEDNIPADYKEEPANAELYFLNHAEAVLMEMWARSRQPGKFAINNITLIEGPTLYQKTANEYIYRIRLQIGWGIS